jgi:hypothetical protein
MLSRVELVGSRSSPRCQGRVHVFSVYTLASNRKHGLAKVILTDFYLYCSNNACKHAYLPLYKYNA